MLGTWVHVVDLALWVLIVVWSCAAASHVSLSQHPWPQLANHGCQPQLDPAACLLKACPDHKWLDHANDDCIWHQLQCLEFLLNTAAVTCTIAQPADLGSITTC
jgi:hypothetical protein